MTLRPWAGLGSLDPELPLIDVRAYDEVALESVGGKRFTALLLGLFAILAAILAGIGVFALTAHGVNSRIREIGIRRALGAGEAELRWLMVRGALVVIAIGVAAGFLALAALAAYLPARRVARIDPGIALRDA